VASTNSDFFQGQADRGLAYWPNHSGPTQLSRQEEEVNYVNQLTTLCKLDHFIEIHKMFLVMNWLTYKKCGNLLQEI
jgi:hypothetical protein